MLYKPAVLMIQKQMSKTLVSLIRQNAIQRSLISTMKYSTSVEKQKQNHEYGPLQKLPVPVLQETLKTYLQSVKPFLNSDEYKNTQKLVNDFENGEGKELQQLLEQRNKVKNNWLSEWWLNTAYLEYRAPVVVYSSPGQVFPVQNFKNETDMLSYAAKLVTAAVNYKLQIDQNKIPQERLGKDNLDMSQYKKVFGTCRQPFPKRDKLIFNSCSTHIVVSSNSNFYKLDVISEIGEQHSETQIFNELQKIRSDSLNQKGPSIGVLTAQTRDDWAKSYETLSSSNLHNINTIETSLFLLCLDDAVSNAEKYTPATLGALQLIHAMGTKGNINNRWYDKTIQFVVSSNGINGITYEHSPSEGQPIAILTDYVVDFIKRGLSKTIQCSQNTNFEPLQFEINQEVLSQTAKANQCIDGLVDNLFMRATVFDGFGKEFIKDHKLSPDSFIQMAIQLAFYRLHQVPGAHYESASLRKFDEGRTECIRSCSVESIAFAKTMLDGSQSIANKSIALKKAIESHKNYVQKAMNGLGCDRHLLGLKLIALENKKPLHKLYADVAFQRSAYMRLSTSQVASQCLSFMCYGPLVSDGYGCCYNPRKNDIIFGLSAFKNPETNLSNFNKALFSSLYEMEHVLRSSKTLAKL